MCTTQHHIIVSSKPSSLASTEEEEEEEDDGAEYAREKKQEDLLKLKTALNSIVNEAMTKRGVEVSIRCNYFVIIFYSCFFIFSHLQVVYQHKN